MQHATRTRKYEIDPTPIPRALFVARCYADLRGGQYPQSLGPSDETGLFGVAKRASPCGIQLSLAIERDG
jgi:hypothetical protein